MRKSHRKSRNGCAQCKQRHIKCNEIKPKCGNCERLNVACSFGPISLLPHSSSAVEAVATPPTQSPAAQPLSMLDMELYHHLVFTFGPWLFRNQEYHDQIFRKVLELALTTDYLLHNYLALSALHLFQSNRSRVELYERACYLQGAAIQQVQPVIADLHQEDAIAALMFSGHTTAFGLAEFMLNPHHAMDPTDPIDKIIECFQLSRGVKIVISPHWRYLSNSWLKPIMDSVPHREKQVRETLESDFATYKLVKSLALGQEDPERRQICVRLIDSVFTYIGLTINYKDEYPTNTHLIDAWAIQLEPAFRDMLAERRPVALIILAYYAVQMSVSPRVWQLQGWPQLLVRRIDSVLGPEWSEFLQWPKQQIFDNPLGMELTPVSTIAGSTSTLQQNDSTHSDMRSSGNPSGLPSPYDHTTPIRN